MLAVPHAFVHADSEVFLKFGVLDEMTCCGTQKQITEETGTCLAEAGDFW